MDMDSFSITVDEYRLDEKTGANKMFAQWWGDV
jgi:hypothetical protein